MANKRYHMLQKSPETIALIAVAKKLLAGDQLHTYRKIERYGVVTGNGKKQEFAHNVRHQLTIAPEGT